MGLAEVSLVKKDLMLFIIIILGVLLKLHDYYDQFSVYLNQRISMIYFAVGRSDAFTLRILRMKFMKDCYFIFLN